MRYRKHFSEGSFWKKLARILSKASRPLLEDALALFYCWQDPATPFWVKSVIAGALGYLIVPFDLIPDVGPAGLPDDAVVLASARGFVNAYILPEHYAKAEARLNDLLGQPAQA